MEAVMDTSMCIHKNAAGSLKFAGFRALVSR